jgi:hypothetical protein
LELLKNAPGVRIIHVHFFKEGYSPNLVSNPLPNVHYVSCNPGVDSFVDPETAVPKKIVSIRKWRYSKGKRPHSIAQKMLFDLSVDKVHSFFANGILVSNSHLEYGGYPFMRPALEVNRGNIAKRIAAAVRGGTGG